MSYEPPAAQPAFVGADAARSTPARRSRVKATRDTPPDDGMLRLASSLLPLISRQGCLTLHCTAAVAGFATSTFVATLAATLTRRTSCRTLIVDLDPDRVLSGTLSGPLMQHRPGADAADTLPTGPRDGSIISIPLFSGSRVPSVKAVREVYDRLAGQFDLVIADAPAVLSAPEIATLASAADGTICLVERERHCSADVRRGHDMLAVAGAKFLGVVVSEKRRPLPRFLGRWL